MHDTPRLPELARSLRSLGATGSPCLEEAHEAIFAPLLDARMAAMRATSDGAVDALNGNAMLQRIEAAVATAATRGVTNAPRARALSAQAHDATESLRRALLALDELAPAVGTDEGWAQWVEQLRRVFATADDSCRALVEVLKERDTRESPPRWYARTTE